MERHREGRSYSVHVSHDGLLFRIYFLIITALADGAVATDALYVSGYEVKGPVDMLGSFLVSRKTTSSVVACL